MRRSTVALERGDPLFEQVGLAVNVARFPALRQQTIQQQASRLLGTAPSAIGTSTTSSSSDALLTVRVLAGTGIVNQEPILRVEVVSEDHDPFVLFLTEVNLDSFAILKEEQALRVNFEGFSLHLVQLFEKCAQGAFRLSLAAAAAPAPTGAQSRLGNESAVQDVSASEDPAAILNVFETTPFRELSHLSLRLERASEVQTRQYLWERLRQENRRVTALHANLKRSEHEIQSKGDEVKDVMAQLEGLKLQLNAERAEFQATIERRHADALKEARLEVSDEERERRERNSQRILELEAKVRQLDDELSKAKEARAQAEAEALRRSGASDALGPLRAEANELRTRCRDLETRAFEESARSARLQEQVSGLERELALKEDAAGRTNELLRAEREKIGRLTEEIEEAKNRVREAEQRVASSETRQREFAGKQDATQDELEALKQKIATKNLVIREQERVVKSHENEIARLKASVQDVERDLSLERTKNNELRTKIQELKQHLEDSAKTLEANASVITYLNRELSAASTAGSLYGSSTMDYRYPRTSGGLGASSSTYPSSSITTAAAGVNTKAPIGSATGVTTATTMKRKGRA